MFIAQYYTAISSNLLLSGWSLIGPIFIAHLPHYLRLSLCLQPVEVIFVLLDRARCKCWNMDCVWGRWPRAVNRQRLLTQCGQIWGGAGCTQEHEPQCTHWHRKPKSEWHTTSDFITSISINVIISVNAQNTETWTQEGCRSPDDSETTVSMFYVQEKK